MVSTYAFTCDFCNRNFETLRGLNIQKAKCKLFIPRVNIIINDNVTRQSSEEVETNILLNADELTVDYESQNIPNLPKIEISATPSNQTVWANMPLEAFSNIIDSTYDEITTKFRKNLFKVPTGKAGKDFIEELRFWMHEFNIKTKLNGIALKTFMILPTLLLQKPSSKSKAKEHSASLTRRLMQWKNGDIHDLLNEVRYIQRKLPSSSRKRSSEDVARIFSRLVMEGKLSAALKVLDEESSNRVLQCTKEVLNELKLKHPTAAEIEDNSLLSGPVQNIPSCFFDGIDEHAIFNAASRTKGAAGPSGMDAELYRKTLCSKSFGNKPKSLREEIALFTRNLATQTYHPQLMESYVSCRLIALDKNPGVRPIGVGEVLRRIVGKTISFHCKEEIKDAAGPLQTCAGHGGGAEAAIHAMRAVFKEDSTDAILLIDATNAFNCLNRLVALHNIRLICPMISTYLVNTYRQPAKLFLSGGEVLLSQEGTTQGDPLAMPWYSLCTTTIIDFLREVEPSVRQVWLADDASAAGKLEPLKQWYEKLEIVGKKCGYYVNKKKCWLIVKSEQLASDARQCFGKSVNVTTDGKRHLGACIGSAKFKQEYCEELVMNWEKQLDKLSEIADSQPQSAYIAYTKGFRSKYSYFLRTIENFELFTDRIDIKLKEVFLPELKSFCWWYRNKRT